MNQNDELELFIDEDDRICDVCRQRYYGRHVCPGYRISSNKINIEYVDFQGLHEPIRMYGDRLDEGFEMLREGGWDIQ